MRVPALLLALLLLLGPGPAAAGPWVRAEGTYLALSADGRGPGAWAGLWAERAAAPGLSLGAVAGRGGRDARLVAFAQRAVLAPGGTGGALDSARAAGMLASLRLGLGVLREGEARGAVLLGASLGRSFDEGIGPGWVALDLDLLGAGPLSEAKLDGIFGLHRGRWTFSLGVQTRLDAQGLHAAVVPAASRAFEWGGVQVGLRAGDAPGLRLALVREF
ncbi:hypothetical protein BCF33_1818 [Hasllibacter halocynthiae]|uniref:Cellulose biosynthesis protein BcsS n=1 Tax=Hasllibacter halocynthiae TaxID=595589 RepID=A0A2T0X272_9RHOB|nr:hypothetical protein [Hasllibacter halocynthiae]PRY92954.1 hypothetical protein BCF33_1818 [Hasllibacter halocynthiae]